jgi:hypothetical protein
MKDFLKNQGCGLFGKREKSWAGVTIVMGLATPVF